MANALNMTCRFRATGTYLDIHRTASTTGDTAGSKWSGEIQAIGFATHEVLDIGSDIATAGWAFLRNQDATNYVEIGLVVTATFYPFAKLMPGEWAIIPLGTLSIYAKANTASVDLEHQVLER
jgi:hypothetical protein